MEKRLEKKNVIWNIIGATANAFTSLFFAVVVTRINGINDAGVFTYAFATACIFYVIAVYAGRAFQVTDISEQYSDTDYIYHRIITCSIMIVTIIAFTLIKGYDITKSFIMILLCLYKATEAFSEVWYAILQRKEYLYQVGISMTMKAVISIVVLWIVDSITHHLILSCFSIICVNIFIILFYDLKNIKQIEITKTSFKINQMKKLFLSGFYTFLITFLGIYLINAPRYAIDDLLESNLQTIFGIIIMPATFMGLMGQYMIQPLLTNVTKSIKEKNSKNLRKIIFFIIMAILGIGGIVLFIAYLLEATVLGFIYGVNLHPYQLSMIVIILGSIMYSLGIVTSYLLIAFRKTFIQAIAYIVVSILTMIISYVLVEKYSILGASITYFLTMLSIAIIFSLYLCFCLRKLKKDWNKQ